MAKVHKLVVGRMNPFPGGDRMEFPIREEDRKGRDCDSCSVSGMDPCSGLQDTLFTSLYILVG
jgi:hypothetical protein